METNTKREKTAPTMTELNAMPNQRGIQMNPSWNQLREQVRQQYGENYFKDRSSEDLIEEIVNTATWEETWTRELGKLTEENAILLQRIEAMKKEITQLRQLNDAYGISLDRFFESRSVTCLKRT